MNIKTSFLASAAYWLAAWVILPPVAVVYVLSSVMAEIFSTIAKASDFVGRRFDKFWS